MRANLTDLTIEEPPFTITTGFPLMSIPVIPEDYPNYDDADLEYVGKLRDVRFLYLYYYCHFR